MYGSSGNGVNMQRLMETTTKLQRVDRMGTSVFSMKPLAEVGMNGDKPKTMHATRPATLDDWRNGRQMHKKSKSRNEGGEESEHLVPKPMPKLQANGEGFRMVHGMADCCGPQETKLTFGEAAAKLEGLVIVENMRKAEKPEDFANDKVLYLFNGNGAVFVPVDRFRLQVGMGSKNPDFRGELYVKSEGEMVGAPEVYANSGKVIF